MAATIEIDESNGAGETVTTNIVNTNMGSIDASGLDPVAYPVTSGTNTFEKWQKIRVVSMHAVFKIDNLKVWRTGTLGGSAVHLSNARERSYVGSASYAQPTDRKSSVATQPMASTEPAGPNLGIGGSLVGAFMSPGSSDYFVHQLQTNKDDTAGSVSVLNYQYDELT